MKLIALIIVFILIAVEAYALTLRSGEVLGSDGKVHKGASPEQKERLKNRDSTISDLIEKLTGIKIEKKKAGIHGRSLWIIVRDEIYFVPLTKLRGKSGDDRVDVVKHEIIKQMVIKELEAANDVKKVTLEELPEDYIKVTVQLIEEEIEIIKKYDKVSDVLKDTQAIIDSAIEDVKDEIDEVTPDIEQATEEAVKEAEEAIETAEKTIEDLEGEIDGKVDEAVETIEDEAASYFNEDGELVKELEHGDYEEKGKWENLVNPDNTDDETEFDKDGNPEADK